MEPERPIEKLLRAYAKKRRGEPGAAHELSPVTRRLLQGEVARLQPAPRREGFFFLRFLGDCRPGLALALSLMVAIAFGGALVLPGLSQAKRKAAAVSAMNNLKQIGRAAQAFAEDNADRLPATLEEMKKYVGSTNVLWDPLSGKQFVYVGGRQPRSELSSDGLLAYSSENRKGRMVLFADGEVRHVSENEFVELAAAAPVPAAARQSNVQQFVQMDSTAGFLSDGKEEKDRLKKTAPLLASFQVRQTGNQVQIVDSDGSVYTGSVQKDLPIVNGAVVALDGSADVYGATARERQVPLQKNAPIEVNRYYFRVSGTNEGLKQTVLFVGELTVTNGGKVQFGGQLPLSDGIIKGTAVTGDGRETRIIARPTSH